MDRRTFSSGLALIGIGLGQSALASDAQLQPLPVQPLQLTRNGWMPNNPDLPVLLYRKAFSPSADIASQMEAVFEKNGWPPQWRNGVYDFHHYHSTAHEVLGFARGWCKVVLGGEGGHKLVLNAGDVALLPTGTGHCKIDASPDFFVVGAYPTGEHWDICRSAPDPATLESIRSVAFPASDPVSGPTGPLLKHWRAQ